MADTVKISALPVATTVSGGEVFPVVQEGITKQVNIEKIFDSVSIPSGDNLIAMWKGDETPLLPDLASGITYQSPSTWPTVDGWSIYSASDGSVAATGGRLVVSGLATRTYLRIRRTASTYWDGKYLRIVLDYDPRLLDIAYNNGTGWTLMSWSRVGNYIVAGALVTTTASYVQIRLYETTISAHDFSIVAISLSTGVYQSPWIDNASGRYNATIAGLMPTAGKYHAALLAAVAGEDATLPSTIAIPHGSPWTVAIRLKAAAAATLGFFAGYKSDGQAGGLLLSAADKLQFRAGTGDGTYYNLTNAIPSPITWTHLVARCDGTKITGYLEGVKGLEATPVSTQLSIQYLFSGYLGGATNAFLGAIESVCIFGRALTDKEIRGLSLGYLPSLPYGLINWQNSYMLDSTITTSSFLINAVSGYVIPTGKYEFSATSPLVQLQFLSDSTWYGASYLSGQVCADGVNVRAYNPTVSGVTVYYRKLDV